MSRAQRAKFVLMYPCTVKHCPMQRPYTQQTIQPAPPPRLQQCMEPPLPGLPQPVSNKLSRAPSSLVHTVLYNMQSRHCLMRGKLMPTFPSRQPLRFLLRLEAGCAELGRGGETISCYIDHETARVVRVVSRELWRTSALVGDAAAAASWLVGCWKGQDRWSPEAQSKSMNGE
ncbi:hypothetical protein BO99DRAFT_224068 [Aspergillus violaceofuscus CBS 115571]|uniref:Uncharacterized protein n=1 Tax=Aspergillus violaceofuscus (strain CBS 115571) TaxID=1450538 RepID=A0A2V5HFF8_ASPV1|nr:hypothetical protein BO99DRAFT_224068 [Aspergillus violaceofuscus CBS 115571]